MPFSITQHKGFQIQLENGITVSVQFGPANYCEHHTSLDIFGPGKVDLWKSKDAEIAIWIREEEMLQIRGDAVEGWLTADVVAEILGVLRVLPATVMGKHVSEIVRLILNKSNVSQDEWDEMMLVQLEIAGTPRVVVQRALAYWNPNIKKGN